MSWDELVVEALGEALGEPGAGADVSALSAREREVVDLITHGLTDADIAHKLAIPRRAVEMDIEHVKQKLGIGDRGGINGWALDQRRNRPAS
jgi:DNA-binding NarL/FixJ family response regulator